MLQKATGGRRAVDVIMCCKGGVRSKFASQWLIQSGWEGEIVEVDDGFMGRLSSGLPVVKGGFVC